MRTKIIGHTIVIDIAIGSVVIVADPEIIVQEDMSHGIEIVRTAMAIEDHVRVQDRLTGGQGRGQVIGQLQATDQLQAIGQLQGLVEGHARITEIVQGQDLMIGVVEGKNQLGIHTGDRVHLEGQGHIRGQFLDRGQGPDQDHQGHQHRTQFQGNWTHREFVYIPMFCDD